MAQDAYIVPRDTLLAEARRVGSPVTPTQLRRWCDVGLMPRPRRKGLGRGRGVQILYPPLAVWQACALAGILRKHRNLDDAGWFLWTLGFPVEAFVRELLLDRLAQEEKEAKALVRGLTRDKYRQALISQAKAEARHSGPGLFQTIGPEAIPTLLKMSAQFRLGTIHEQPYSENDWLLFQEGSLSALFPDDLDILDDPELPKPSEVERGVNRLSREIPLAKVRSTLKRTEDRELRVLRSEALGLVTHVTNAFGIEERPMLPEDFVSYFARMVVDAEGSEQRKKLYREMGWKRPPYTAVETWILRRMQSAAGGKNAKSN